jgi:Ca2+-binding EF-hand superfamily protein
MRRHTSYLRLNALVVFSCVLCWITIPHLAAQDAEQPRDNKAQIERIFKQRDRDGDGKLSRDELGNLRQFRRLDADGDGFVTLEEAKAVVRQREGRSDPAAGIEKRFKALDKNGDRKLTLDEMPDREQFKAQDLDGDGTVTLEEMTKATMPTYAGAGPEVSFTPLIDMDKGMYQGYPGGLYPGGNAPPEAYLQQGLAAAGQIRPLDRDGQPAGDGAIVLLSIGMSNTTREFSRFKKIADADLRKNPRLLFVDGAQGGQDAETIKNPTCRFWTVLDQRLAAAGASGKQVQVAWVKEAIAREQREFPKDAEGLRDDLQLIVQILRDRFPNLRIIYVSNRTYAGYAQSSLNPEPVAYQSGFAVKWLIEERIEAAPDNAPWVAWGPYLWTDGVRGRSDKMVWLPEDAAADGTHPSPTGIEKVAALLLQFLTTDETAKTWFLKAP